MSEPIEWAEKYRPSTLSDVVGNKKALESLKKWAEEWLDNVPEKRAVILHGRAGIGKTSTAYALANDFGWEVIELNASDQRTAEVINKIAGSASKTGSLFGSGGKRLIVLDEADNLHGTNDRGGARAISETIKKTDQPVVLIANDVYGVASSIRNQCLEIKFNNVQTRSIAASLKKICKKEDINCDDESIEKLAQDSDGDVRSAINDLQAAVSGNELHIEDIATSQRDTEESIFKVLTKIFKGHDINDALNATYGIDESPEDMVHWIDENLPAQFKHEIDDIKSGYGYLSKADIYLGRVRNRQNYRLWRYANILMIGGMVVSRSQNYKGFIKFSPPSYWRKLGQMRAKRDLRDNIASKIAQHNYKSIRHVRSNLTPVYTKLLKDDDYAVDITADLNLSLDELVYLTGSKKTTKRLKNIHQKAESMVENFSAPDSFSTYSSSTKKTSSKKKNSKLDESKFNKNENTQTTSKTEDEPSQPVDQSEYNEKKSQDKSQKSLFDF
ncbi:AAA ATPase central domain protein [Methanohalobium evestigatum Z-7303]|uniref:Replication factor C large subunit n=1 Tax=Methanohalobium evestigatum (strain ATCC BAA-1072 / DSM 3721 / NBRC 107634 / OCM 161 / Z-7303) TaxID=644295 RepID=D7E9H6_METEZ|nr:replication factor C large subunit [Methanohalobium evestigatum]ADI74248.1 AAA ATPase central domain protein [Methanohalobium evestigatum Z-7303]